MADVLAVDFGVICRACLSRIDGGSHSLNPIKTLSLFIISTGLSVR